MRGLSLMNISTLCNIEIFFFLVFETGIGVHVIFIITIIILVKLNVLQMRSFFMNSMFSTQSKEY